MMQRPLALQGEHDMDLGPLGTALEREHREIDGGIETYTAQLAAGHDNPQPLRRAMEGLRRHIYLEEVFLFPPLKDAGLTMPVFVMLREHGELWNLMDAVEGLLDGEAASDAVRSSCLELLARLEKHNAKEEPIIYPEADKVLSAPASAELGSFLASGLMPEGWVCSRARS